MLLGFRDGGQYPTQNTSAAISVIQGWALYLCEELPQTVTDNYVFLTDERKGLGKGRDMTEVTQQVGVRLMAGSQLLQDYGSQT